MKITLEPTARMVEVVAETGTLLGRIWQGHTDHGVEIVAVITRLAAERSQDLSELDRVLNEVAEPTVAALEAIPMRLIL